MIAFTGCSFTAGHGLNADALSDEVKNSPYLWTNLGCSQIAELQGMPSVNYAKNGASNTDIFEQAIYAIAKHGKNLKYIFCQWTSAPRYTFSPGIDPWLKNIKINTHLSRKLNVDINLSSGIVWSKDYINDLIDRFLVMHHLHHEVLKVVRYANTIGSLAEMIGSTVIFINGLCPWDDQYFVKIDNATPEQYTNFTKYEILDIDNRTDEDIEKLYSMIHQDYHNAGGVDPNQWINLYEPWNRSQVDKNHDGLHPGILSNQDQANQVKQYFKIFKSHITGK